jgi:hypothetical protein
VVDDIGAVPLSRTVAASRRTRARLHVEFDSSTTVWACSAWASASVGFDIERRAVAAFWSTSAGSSLRSYSAPSIGDVARPADLECVERGRNSAPQVGTPVSCSASGLDLMRE